MTYPWLRLPLRMLVVVVVAPLSVGGCAGCGDTGVLLTVVPGNAPADQVRVDVHLVDGTAIGKAATLPDTPRALNAQETVELQLADDVVGKKVVVDAKGLSKGNVVSAGTGTVEIVAGQLVALEVDLTRGAGEGEGEGEGAGGEGEGEGGEGEGEGNPAVCGNDVVEAGEGCDDGGTSNGDGCNDACAPEAGFVCTGSPSECVESCGNGAVDAGEDCDDNNLVDGDGCTSSCAVELGFTCVAAPSTCVIFCGDGLVRGNEQCDDGNGGGGDGCAGDCTIENGNRCDAEPSVCGPGCVIAGVTFFAGEADGNNACAVCDPNVDGASLTTAGDGTSCDDPAQLCDLGARCSGGTCTPSSPNGNAECVGTTSLCIAALDGGAGACGCDATSCDDGVFCNGVESCGNGTCGAGGGNPCGAPTPVCVEGLRGCVQCEVSVRDCGGGAPFCVNGACVDLASSPCPNVGDHNGGDGSCVPEGTCAAGFLEPFVDADGDGRGAGSRLADCVAIGTANRVDVGGDCDDGDGGVFQLSNVFGDLDGDSFTGVQQTLCIGNGPPAGFVATANPPPLQGIDAGDPSNDTANGGNGNWTNVGAATFIDGNNATVDTANNSATHTLVLARFDARGFQVPDGAVVRGVVVHIFRQKSGNPNRAVQDANVTLAIGGARVGNNHADGAVWSQQLVDEVYGSQNDTWGLALTAGDVKDAGFGVALSVQGGQGATAEVDGARIEIFVDSGADCDDADGAVFSSLFRNPDVDRDGVTAGQETRVCVDDNQTSDPAGFVRFESGAGDCDDGDPSVHPGQNAFFVEPRGNGTFDYDCSGGDDVQGVQEASACDDCSVDGVCNVGAVSSVSINAACGEVQTVNACRTSCDNCATFATTTLVRCH